MLSGNYASNQLTAEYKPVFYKLGENDQAEQLKKLLSQNPSIQIYDTIQSQLSELAKINNPHKILSPGETQQFIETYTGGKNPDEYGVWVYYSWSQKLVHLLEEEAFIKLRTSRNLYKITPEELTILRKKKTYDLM